jgi:hypothetical protein
MPSLDGAARYPLPWGMLTQALLLCVLAGAAFPADVDTDGDGLPDQLEQALLERFALRLRISAKDCDVAPAEFLPAAPYPQAIARNGTVYGQVFPVHREGAAGSFVEIHFYHLWARDCGLTAHPLDAEAVYGLLRANGDERSPEAWKAEYWVAAAHEGTLCDMSNGANAAALAAADRGPDVWASRGKHASYLSLEVCSRGCGNEQCDDAQPMRIAKLVNLGEPGLPMNGAVWSQSASWPLASKMKPRYTNALIGRMPAGDEVALVPEREVPRGTRSTAKVAGLTYGSLLSANESAGAGFDAGVEASRASVRHALKAAFSATGRSLKRVFGAPALPQR